MRGGTNSPYLLRLQTRKFLCRKITARFKLNLKTDGPDCKIIFKFGSRVERLHSARKQCRRIYICLFCVAKRLLGSTQTLELHRADAGYAIASLNSSVAIQDRGTLSITPLSLFIAIPLHRNNCHSFPCRNAVQLAADRDLLQMCHGNSFPNCPPRICTFSDSQGFLHIVTVYRETPANATISGKSSAKSHSSSTKGAMYSNQFEKVRFSEFSGSFIKWYFRISKPCCKRFQRGDHRLVRLALSSTVWHAMPCGLHKSYPARGEAACRISRPGL